MYDCFIIGGGPAGLNAALVLGRARRKLILFDNNKPRNRVAHESHGFLTRDGVKPDEFRRIAYEEVGQYPSVEFRQAEVVDVKRIESGFQVMTACGERVEARKIILATGIQERFPTIEGFEALYGTSLSTCPYCDGWEFQEKPLVVISEYPIAFHFAKIAYNWSRELVLCTNGANPLSEEQEAVLKSRGIAVNKQPIAELVGRDGRLEMIRFQDGTHLRREAGFVTPLRVQAPFGDQLGCQRDERGGIVTDGLGRTNVKGVYAAGDTSVIAPSQLIIAAGEGSRAGIGVNMELSEEEFDTTA